MPPIFVSSSAEHIATQILVIAKLNGRGFILRGFVCDIIRPYKELPVQSQQLKHKNKGVKTVQDEPFKRQSPKMVKLTQTIRRQSADELFECV